MFIVCPLLLVKFPFKILEDQIDQVFLVKLSVPFTQELNHFLKLSFLASFTLHIIGHLIEFPFSHFSSIVDWIGFLTCIAMNE